MAIIELVNYLKYVASLKNNDVPDYEFCRNLFMKKMAELKCSSPYTKLSFTVSDDIDKKESKSPAAKGRKKIAVTSKPTAVKNERATKKRKSPKRTVNEEDEEETASIEADDNDDEPLAKKKVGRSNNKAVKADHETDDNNEPLTKKKVANHRSNKVVKTEDCETDNVNGVSNTEEQLWKEKGKSAKKTTKRTQLKKHEVHEAELDEEPQFSGENGVENSNAGDSDIVENKLTVKGRKTKKASAVEKPGWEDAPTIKASGVKIAGVYEKIDTTDTKTKRKKK